jgi:predicted S18 family serine protease
MLAIFLLTVSIWSASFFTSAEALSHAACQTNSLTANLFAVLSSYDQAETESLDDVEALHDRIAEVSSKIDSVSSLENSTEASYKAAVACNISQLLFPGLVISEDPKYTKEKEAHW